MEIITAFLPLLIFIVYLAIIVIIIGFFIWVIKSQNDRNNILKEISKKLDVLVNNQKGE
ncbi:hypothetical protein [Viridibacillus sp. FSL H8-0123]|uniref:hypothetical protein n=1 Tax=Viridibacillus sp. FSL H8-0123 TaxID=1928922 RepID=UPI00143C3871|nr:hypothetical protein [Viridibacillus sp. FSL H8-0123]